ncbi:hypothetical protein [Peterkaempfera sp. SMS 1(5)a]|uniref:hypothetical protein n=1 Tax=Peterkaempfera podocarpi TaxID=3232308 RepID=UPI00366BE378
MRQLISHTEQFAAEGSPDAVVVAPHGQPRPEPYGREKTGAEPASQRVRRAGRLLVTCGLVLLPWLCVLATGLPATATAAHWPLAWIGLDALEAAGLIVTGVLASRGDVRHALAATATATLLVIDAWFDTTTATAGSDLDMAAAMACCAELPLAALCVWLAIRALGRRA